MIKLSIHVQTRIQQRQLDVAWIKATLAAPDWQTPDTDPTLTRSFKAITAFGGRILKVVHRPAGDDTLIVIAYFDRSARP